MQIPQSLLAKKLCLVVDDFQGMRTMLRDMLREGGATQIDLASNGKEALHRLQEQKFDIVLCDYNLGPGKNGQQVLEEAKVRKLIGPACTWVMVTAEKASDGIMGAMEYQPDAYLIKPVTTDLLLSRLERIAVKKQAFGDIDRALTGKHYAKALKLCEEQLQYDKTNAAELLRLKASILVTMGDEAAARTLYESVLGRREIAWARIGLGRICFDDGDYEAAAGHFRTCIEANAANMEAYDWLAKAEQYLGNLDQAEAVLTQALKLSPNSPTRQRNLGELALRRGDLETADRAFRKSIAVGEHSIFKTADAYIGLAKVFGATDRSDEAMKVLKTAVTQFNQDEVRLRAKSTEGLIHKRNEHLDAANAAANEVAQILATGTVQADEAASLEAAELLLATGHKEAGIALLQSVVRNNHENEALLEQVKGVFAEAGMGEEGAGVVEGSRKEAVDAMNQGVLLARSGKLDEALEAMRSAKSEMAGNARVLLNFAHVAISYMSSKGVDNMLLDECRQALYAAHKLAPADKRYAQLSENLTELEKSRPPA
ncbi:MAG: response regulator [Burkholderiales bacterium]|nr:response regulator [Burkholderiales bacterium]